MSAERSAYRPTSSWNKTPQQEHGKCKDHRVPMKPPCASADHGIFLGLPEKDSPQCHPTPLRENKAKWRGSLRDQWSWNKVKYSKVLSRGLLRDQLMRTKTTEQIPYFLYFGWHLGGGCHLRFPWNEHPNLPISLGDNTWIGFGVAKKRRPQRCRVQVHLFWDVQGTHNYS